MALCQVVKADAYRENNVWCFPWPVCSIFLPVGQRSFRDPELERDFKEAETVLVILEGAGVVHGMTDSCCSCLPRACPGLHVRSKSLHEAGGVSGCLTYLSAGEAIPSLRRALGMVLFHLVLCPDEGDRKGFGEGLPGRGGAMHQGHRHMARGRSVGCAGPGGGWDRDVCSSGSCIVCRPLAKIYNHVFSPGL